MMIRILLSMAVLALVAVGAFQIVGTQECAAVSTTGVISLAKNQPAAPSEPTAVPTADFAWPAAQAESASLAQNDSYEPFEQPVPASTKRTIKVPRTTTVYEDRVVEVEKVTPLQQQYSVLMLKRAQRMSQDELKTAIEKVEAELKEQDEAADAELQNAIDILNQLQENSSGTPAARRAAGALPILEGSKTPQSGSTAPFMSAPSATLQPGEIYDGVPTY